MMHNIFAMTMVASLVWASKRERTIQNLCPQQYNLRKSRKNELIHVQKLQASKNQENNS